MKKKYFSIVLLVMIVLAGVYYWGFNFIYNSSSNDLMNQQLKLAQYQSELVANMLSSQLEKGFSKEQVTGNLQDALELTIADPVFICMFNKYGKEICHPDRKKVGMTFTDDDSTIKSFSNMVLEENFKTVLRKHTPYGGLHTIKDGNKTEIIYLEPVKGTDWIIATHSNLASLDDNLNTVKTQLILFFYLTWLCSVVLILFLISLLYQKYFNKISRENLEIQNLIENKLIEKQTDSQKKNIHPPAKRFLAEKGLNLIPVEIENIAFIYLENKITYIIDCNKVKSTLNLSLEEIYQLLPKEQFFKASRQIILSLKAIRTIEKYGTVQLRVITDPVSDIPIIISKARVSEFKFWMGKK
jgi:DNA-binding LytR/AlgR family response regulator